MSQVVYINKEEGKKRVMNNGKLYAKLLAKLKTDIKLDDLANFAAAMDWEKAQGAAHAIKGIAANLSLTELFNQSLDVETQIKGKSLKQDSLANLQTCFVNTLAAAEKVIAEYA